MSEWLLVNLHQTEDLFLSLSHAGSKPTELRRNVFQQKAFYFRSDMPVTQSKDVTLYCISEISKHVSLWKRAFRGKNLCAE